MDLRIGNDRKVRLTKSDYENLRRTGGITQHLVVSDEIKFDVQVNIDSEREVSSVETSPKGVTFSLSAKDVEQIALRENKRSGIVVDGYEIQIDMWDETKRKKLRGARVGAV
jgi:hypothetical protein